MTRTRLMSALYLLGKRRAQREAQRGEDDLVGRFECLNEQTNSEIRALRDEIFRMHALDDALAVERPDGGWLH